MKDTIRQAGLEAGFDRVGFGPAAPPPSAHRLRHWLAAGRSAGMRYMEKDPERRSDPRRVFPEARSVIAAALAYRTLPDASTPPATIARYARVPDYHKIAARMLARVTQRIGALGGKAAAFVDTGPLLERALAAQAGLGWIGRNTCLFTPGLGSWCFLGIVLTDLDLEPDPELAPLCGDCRLCLDACPTGALGAPFELDARLCLSYHTVENRRAIPLPVREALGDSLLGCDRCQEACPHNRDVGWAGPGMPRPLADLPSLRDILVLTEERFRARLAATSLSRPGRRGLVRNGAAVAGSLGLQEFLPELRALLRDPDPVVREHAAWAVERIAARC